MDGADQGQAAFGTYATTPIILDGMVYTQDIDSNVYAIDLKTGKVKWYKKYNSPSVGPNGVTVVGRCRLRQHRRFRVRHPGEHRRAAVDQEADPQRQRGHRHGARHPRRHALRLDRPRQRKGFYKGNGQAILWALDAKTGDVKWKWDEVPTNLWSNKHTDINSGGGQWDPPSFDANGDVYIGVSNPAPFPGTKDSRRAPAIPGPNLYTDSIVKLDHKTGKLDWYYQLTPHDINDWDMQNSPILTTVNGKDVVIDGGKAGIVVAVDQRPASCSGRRRSASTTAMTTTAC